jgi:hypothetical protein
VTYFISLSWDSPGDTEESHGNSVSGYPVLRADPCRSPANTSHTVFFLSGESWASFIRSFVHHKLFLWLPFSHGCCHSINSHMMSQCLDSPNFQRTWCARFMALPHPVSTSVCTKHTVSPNYPKSSAGLLEILLSECSLKGSEWNEKHFLANRKFQTHVKKVSRGSCTPDDSSTSSESNWWSQMFNGLFYVLKKPRFQGA